ncbi:OmpA/MotB family protein [Aquimarina rhabdastrellae]
MIKKIVTIAVIGAMMTSCVSSKVYKELESKYSRLKRDNRGLKEDLASYKKSSEAAESELEKLKKAYEALKAEQTALQDSYANSQKQYENLKQSYDALEKNSSNAIAANSKKNRELLSELENKEKALFDEKQRLEKLEKDLASRSARVNELEGLIAAKDKKMQGLKTALSKALTNFEGKGLTVEQRNGKVYVSMENKLLFKSGSWAVGTNGKQAIKQLGEVLAENPDISILIEGHTDNDPYIGSGPLKGNWDLSTKRATAIVTILRGNKKIDPQNLTAAGRGEYAPVADNATAAGKAKNRRIEVILTPKLDEVTKLLNNI